MFTEYICIPCLKKKFFYSDNLCEIFFIEHFGRFHPEYIEYILTLHY